MWQDCDWRDDSSIEEWFEATVKRLRPELIRRIKRRYRLSDDDAEDIVQQGLLSAYCRLHDALRRHVEFDLELHIRTMVDYSARDYMRKESKRCARTIFYEELPEGYRALVDDSYLDLPDLMTQRDERNQQRFWQVVEQVLPSEKQRWVLWLVAEDFDLKEAAYELGVTHDNARRLKSDAIEKLSVSTVFCQACRDFGYQHLPPEWLVGEQLGLAFAAVRRRTKAHPSQVSNSVEVRTVQESTVRSFWMIVDSCLDDDTDRLLLRLVLGDECLAIEQAAKVLCLDTTTAKRRFSQALKRLRCSEKLYEFCRRNGLIPTTIEEVE